jgi:hypothetical protein
LLRCIRSLGIYYGVLTLHEELKKRADLIRKWNDGLGRGVTLRLIRTEGPQSKAMAAFIRDFTRLAPRIVLEETAGRDEALPGLYIADSWQFHFVPEGMELDPFLDLLSAIDRGMADIRDDLRGILENHPGRIFLTLFLSTHCPNCPLVMRQIAPLPLVNPGIRLTVIDGLLFPDLAVEHRIQAVPTLIGEGGVRWTGRIRLEAVIEALCCRDEDRFSRQILEQMITEGNAAPLADTMIRAGRLFPAFLDVLTHDLFSVRLGAMVVMEELGERAPDLARTALEPLWEKMAGVDETVQGDIVYLIGVIGDPGWVSRLETLVQGGASPDLEDAVQDALGLLASK